MDYSKELTNMMGENPLIETQIYIWQYHRIKRDENPHDWAAFCIHLGRIGAPFPGGEPPPEFLENGQPEEEVNSVESNERETGK